MTKTASNNDLSISSENSPKKGNERKVAISGHFFSNDKLPESAKITSSHLDKSLSSENPQSKSLHESLNDSKDSKLKSNNNKLMFDKFSS